MEGGMLFPMEGGMLFPMEGGMMFPMEGGMMFPMEGGMLFLMRHYNSCRVLVLFTCCVQRNFSMKPDPI